MVAWPANTYLVICVNTLCVQKHLFKACSQLAGEAAVNATSTLSVLDMFVYHNNSVLKVEQPLVGRRACSACVHANSKSCATKRTDKVSSKGRGSPDMTRFRLL